MTVHTQIIAQFHLSDVLLAWTRRKVWKMKLARLQCVPLKSTHFYQLMPYEALIIMKLLLHETNWDLSLRAIFHELRLKLSGNTNNQVFTARVLQTWAFKSNFKPNFLKAGWGKIPFPKKYGHPRDTQSLTAPKHFSRRHDKDLKAHLITGVYFHQKSVIYFCQGSMISKWCYAWIYCFKSGLDPVYLSKLIELILSINKAYNLPWEV